jgi:DNA topoisomerase-1
MVEGMVLNLGSIEPLEHETKPPARFTEATLVQELEKQGIGRPSTYATIIDKLFEKEYVVKDGSALVPTFIGFAVVQLLEKHFAELVDYEFTSRMENELDSVAEGNGNQLDFLKTFYEGERGLKSQVDVKLAKVKPSEAKHIELPHVRDPFQVMVGKFGPYVTKRDDSQDDKLSASIPEHYHPGTVSQDDLERLLEKKSTGSTGPDPLFTDGTSGLPVYLMNGKFGPFFQLGLKSEELPKPKKVSVPKGMDPAGMERELISQLLHLPRNLGTHPDSGKPVIATIGPYGPYVGCDKEYRSLKDVHKLFSISLGEALAMLAAPKPGKGGKGAPGKGKAAEPVRSFEELDGKQLAVFNGKYGFYGKWGKDNFALPKEMKSDASALEALTRDQMVELAHAPKPERPAARKRR